MTNDNKYFQKLAFNTSHITFQWFTVARVGVNIWACAH